MWHLIVAESPSFTVWKGTGWKISPNCAAPEIHRRSKISLVCEDAHEKIPQVDFVWYSQKCESRKRFTKYPIILSASSLRQFWFTETTTDLTESCLSYIQPHLSSLIGSQWRSDETLHHALFWNRCQTRLKKICYYMHVFSVCRDNKSPTSRYEMATQGKTTMRLLNGNCNLVAYFYQIGET